MTIRVALNHRTTYRYDRPVALTPHVVRLRPAPHCRTPVVGYSLRVQPGKHFLNWQQDPFGNYLARLVFPEASRELAVEVDLVVEMVAINPFEFFVDPVGEKYPFEYEAHLHRELRPFLEVEEAGPLLRAVIEGWRRKDVRTVDFLVELNAWLQGHIGYVIRLEPGIQTPEETLTKLTGSCRDTGWLLVTLLRHLGLAARFVSGYLIQLVADLKALDGPSGPTADFTDLHAWAEVYLPGAGWIGLDPTSGLFCGEGHIPLAATADPPNAAPITGSFLFDPDPRKGDEDKVEVDFTYRMTVRRVLETPRVTLPYSEEQWQAIQSLGDAIDADLEASDVRLTMGGEPTFVSLDDPDGSEWNSTALGDHKRERAGVLLRRLRDRWATGAVLHFGQGKWYPGEQLPRWALGCIWRTDGVPVWNDPALIADDDRDYAVSWSTVRAFGALLAEKLSVDPANWVEGFEDTWYHLWRERRLPVNVDPHDSKLADEMERERLARIFEQDLGQPVGMALPLERRRNSPAWWVSGRWFFRSERMYLHPGDSPMGLRMPLDSLPWSAAKDRNGLHERDPLEPRPALPRQRAVPTQPQAPRGVGPLSPQVLQAGQSARDVVRTALCLQVRGGRLLCFLPPLEYAEDFLDLVAALEATAAEMRLPIQLEGYPPPYDPRLCHFTVTPDPGVIEVNIHPAHSWRELVERTTSLYDEARQSRLGTEKFQPDGRHTGTGGGNHVVLGGPTPADSPLLRRPDLLRSLVAFWHNHPALSYLFSSLFVGPTSQAPRLDEARNDSVYEMEIAFAQIRENTPAPPWLVDRVFRHLLVDVTGNTHRAEFCIDKLYSPDSTAGRRGLLELRAFEMPPHARMSCVQMLLLRGLVASFWHTPYQQPLVRWGTSLHDRFLLPHFVEQDLRDALAELREAGHDLDPAWFAPHVEFRFPHLGSVQYRDLILELRQAIEPWHVVGEEPGAGGTIRAVDSTLDRVQLLVRGLVEPRHAILCNGRRVPLHSTGTEGEYVAGVRFKAWVLPSALHPTIPLHAPLTFDIVDTWTGRAVAGCRYHADHPGGRNVESRPINALEAESRRVARFFAFGHSPGLVVVPAVEVQPEFPLTLDLRTVGPTVHPEVARALLVEPATIRASRWTEPSMR